MKLTKYGKKEWLGGGVIALTLILACLYVAINLNLPIVGYSFLGLVAVVYFALAAFFRDPVRVIPTDTTILISPADGVIKDIELLKDSDENEFFGGKSIVRVGIFLSVLDVHLNRAPCDIVIEDKSYRKGKYHDARSPLASKENEAMTIFCSATANEKAFPMILRQISGAIAKRIVCMAEKGIKYSKGEQFGMIKFGSRTEIYLPAETWMTLSVEIGDRVLAGTTVVAKINNTPQKK